jgi:hypothetical protein
MNKSIISSRPWQLRPAFSLVETVTVLVITAMILIAAIGIYSRTRDAAADVNQKLDADELPMEILQRIAEDIDRLAAPGFDTTIGIRNKIREGYNICQLTIQNRIYDKDNKPRDFEKIIWQTYKDPLEEGLSLYRLHTGLNLEGNVDFDFRDSALQNEDLFVRLCTGITYFKVQVPIGDDFADNWTSNRLPNAVTVTVSFAEPFENISGELEIYEEDMIIRTIAVDRTRTIKYKFVPKDFSEYDPNNIDETLLDSDDTSGTTDRDEVKDDEDEDKK